MSKIMVGREEEIKILNKYCMTDKNELAAVY